MQLPPSGGHVARRKIDGSDYYLPLEMNMTSQSWPAGSVGGMYSKYSWFTYGAGKDFKPSSPFPAGFLYRYIKRGYAQGASTVLLACAPDHTGRMREADVRELLKLGCMLKDPSLAPAEPVTFGGTATASGVWPNPHLTVDLAFDDNLATRWGGAPDSKSSWLTIDLGTEKSFSRLWVSEAYDRVRRFELQVDRGGAWQTGLRTHRLADGDLLSSRTVPSSGLGEPYRYRCRRGASWWIGRLRPNRTSFHPRHRSCRSGEKRQRGGATCPLAGAVGLPNRDGH